MAHPDRDREQARRRNLLFTFATQGAVGMVVLALVAVLRWREPLSIVHALGLAETSALVLIFFGFCLALGLLKFELTEVIFVSLTVSACIAMVPLLGAVLSPWIAVLAAMVCRMLAMKNIGAQKLDMSDPLFETVKTAGLFGTYGIPVAAAAIFYELTGGVVPLQEPSLGAAMRIASSGLILIATNNLIMARAMRAYGYDAKAMWSLTRTDATIYLLTIPYAVSFSLLYGSLGLGGVVAMACTCVIVTAAARRRASRARRVGASCSASRRCPASARRSRSASRLTSC